ncbi:MAG: RNA-binding protein [Flavobacteriia bacterium]|nr:RNA-binding protein [Flavobacteriia bacterium]
MKIKFSVLVLFFVFNSNAQKIGDKIEVLWNGSYFPATVKNVNEKEKKWFIGYDTYADTWDEWITADRIKSAYKIGDKIEVDWNASWYEAKIIDIKDQKYKISYVGYDSNWDEWVDLKRMRRPKK